MMPYLQSDTSSDELQYLVGAKFRKKRYYFYISFNEPVKHIQYNMYMTREYYVSVTENI